MWTKKKEVKMNSYLSNKWFWYDQCFTFFCFLFSCTKVNCLMQNFYPIPNCVLCVCVYCMQLCIMYGMYCLYMVRFYRQSYNHIRPIWCNVVRGLFLENFMPSDRKMIAQKLSGVVSCLHNHCIYYCERVLFFCTVRNF